MPHMPWVIAQRDEVTARRLLRQYLAVNDLGTPEFAGSWFDVLGRLDGDDDADRITSDDIVAAHLVGAVVPPHTALALLTSHADVATDLLRRIPADLDLLDAEADVFAADSTVSRLRESLQRTGDGLSVTSVSKLLARKRPGLVPMWDPTIFQATGADAVTYPEWVRRAVREEDGALWTWLQEQVKAVPEASHLTPLRTLDILLWTSTWSEHHWGVRRSTAS